MIESADASDAEGSDQHAAAAAAAPGGGRPKPASGEELEPGKEVEVIEIEEKGSGESGWEDEEESEEEAEEEEERPAQRKPSRCGSACRCCLLR